MTSGCDMLDRKIHEDDFVVFHNNIYRVKTAPSGNSYARIMLVSPSKTTRPVVKYTREMCIIPREDVMEWVLRTGIELK